MNITFYQNKSDPRTVNKDITEVISMEGSFRSAVDVTAPVFTIKAGDLLNVNYCYIEKFGRFYYVENIKAVVTGLYEISCKVDVLMTYKEQFLPISAIIEKQESEYNLYLNDGTFKVYQNPMLATINFPAGFSAQSYVLAVAGS